MIETIRQGLKEDGLAVSVSKLCRWIGVPRRTVYYRPTKKAPIVQQRFAQPIKQLIEEHPPSAIARWLTCWALIRTPYSVFSS